MKRIVFSLMAVLFSVVAFAQSGGADINVDVTKSDGGAGFPWMWVIGGLVVLILLVVLLTGSRGGTDVVEKRTTVIKE